MPSNEKKYRLARDKRAAYLALRVQGVPKDKARDQVGWTFYGWESCRRDHPEFKAKDDAITARLKAGGEFRGSDFVTFRKTYFGWDTPAHHMLMIDAIESAPADSVTLILAPPFAAKTALLTDWINWKLAEDANYRVGILSLTENHAKKMVGQVARRMTDEQFFPAYIARYGPFKSPDRETPKPWNAHAITLLGATHDERDPSLEARGRLGQLYGARLNAVILDDVQDTKRLGETEKLLEWFRQDVLTRPDALQGRTIVIGSRVGHGDFYERLLDEPGLVDRCVQIRAIQNGESYWPEVWPVERLLRRKEKVGHETWARAYQQQPVSKLSATFPDELIRNTLDDRELYECPNDEAVRIVTCDPALTGHSAVVSLAYDADRMWVLDCEKRPGLARIEAIVEMFAQQARVVRPSFGIFEVGAFQGALARDRQLDEFATQMGFRVYEHQTSGRKQDAVLGVAQMATSFSLGEIHIPNAPSAQARMQPLLEQLTNWRPDIPTRLLEQDLVMALWFGWKWWQENRTALTMTSHSWQSRALPFRAAAWRRGA